MALYQELCLTEEVKRWKEHNNATVFLFTWVMSGLSTEAETFTVSIGNVTRTGWPTENILEITAYTGKKSTYF